MQTARHAGSADESERTAGVAPLEPPPSSDDEEEGVGEMLKQAVKELETALQVKSIGMIFESRCVCQ